MKQGWLLLVLVVVGCSKSTPKVDAGSVVVHRATDLRTAMMVAYPEFRGARMIQSSVTLQRRMDRTVPLDEVIPKIEKNEFTVVREGDHLTCTRAPYKLEVQGPNMTVSMPLAEGDAAKLLSAPSSLSSEQLALWFPKVAGATTAGETFRLELRYEATPTRAQYLAWQMVSLNTQGSWKVTQYPTGYEVDRRPDGGGGATPEEYRLELIDSTTAATIRVYRKDTVVELEYLLKTYEWQ